jgi:HAD superfamily hydrolase (TIGR01548 family)
MREQLIVFDMDGVLVDDTESYRDTIIATVKHFTGREVTRELIQDYKNQGGWNSDWALAQKIARDLGVEVEYDTLVDEFNALFFGNGRDGLILREKWIAKPGVLERLGERFQLGIYTGRTRFETEPTLERYAFHLRFSPVVCADDVPKGKPAPDGLLQAARLAAGKKLWYVGDTVDDARAARAAEVPFIGVAPKSHLRYDKLLRLFQAENAASVIESINQLESVFSPDGRVILSGV